MDFQWYTEIHNSEVLQQGDLIPNLPIIDTPKHFNYKLTEKIDLKLKLINAIVMSQSCDLENDKLQYVLVCPYFKISETANAAGGNLISKITEINKGNIVGLHLLNKVDDNNELLIVDFKVAFSIELLYLKEHCKQIPQRYRLNPPFREHLSQAFARMYMRVGLPNSIDISELKSKSKK